MDPNRCAICFKLCPDHDRLPFGAGIAHVACAMQLTVQIRTAYMSLGVRAWYRKFRAFADRAAVAEVRDLVVIPGRRSP